MTTMKLSPVEIAIVEKLVQNSQVLDVLNGFIYDKVNNDNGNSNVMIPKKNLYLNTSVFNNKADSVYMDLNIRFLREHIERTIESYTELITDDYTLVTQINTIKYMIQKHDSIIKEITNKADIDENNIGDLIKSIIDYDVAKGIPIDALKIDIKNCTGQDIIDTTDILQYCFKAILTYYITLEYTNSYVEYLNKYLMDCIHQQKIGYIRVGIKNQFTKLYADILADVLKKSDHIDGHATVIIFNGVNNTLEYFDPNGETSSANYYNESMAKLLAKIFHNISPTIINFQPKTQTPKHQYVNIQSKASMHKTDINNAANFTFEFGICGLYSLWFLHQRLAYIASNEYHKRLVDKKIDMSSYTWHSKNQYLRASLYYESEFQNTPPLPKENLKSSNSGLINPLNQYALSYKALHIKDYPQKVALSNHEDILSYGIKCASLCKINGRSLWDRFSEIIKKYKAELNITDKIRDEIKDIVLDLFYDIAYEKVGPCLYHYESINDYYMNLYWSLENLLMSNVFAKLQSGLGFSTALYYHNAQRDDIMDLRNRTKYAQFI